MMAAAQSAKSASRMDNVRFRENCTLLAGAKGKKWLLDLDISQRGQAGEMFDCKSITLTETIQARAKGMFSV